MARGALAFALLAAVAFTLLGRGEASTCSASLTDLLDSYVNDNANCLLVFEKLDPGATTECSEGEMKELNDCFDKEKDKWDKFFKDCADSDVFDDAVGVESAMAPESDMVERRLLSSDLEDFGTIQSARKLLEAKDTCFKKFKDDGPGGFNGAGSVALSISALIASTLAAVLVL